MNKFFSAIATLCLASLIPLLAAESVGVITKETEVTLEGKVVGSVKVGQAVTIHGNNEHTAEVLISAPSISGAPMIGMVPAAAVIEAGKPQATAQPGEPAPPPAVRSDRRSPARQEPVAAIPATELAVQFQQDRAKSVEQVGQQMVVSGTVAALELRGTGSTRSVTLTLQTEVGQPKVVFQIPGNYLMSEDFWRRIRLVGNTTYSSGARTVNFRSRRDLIEAQSVWEYTYTHRTSSGRTHQSQSKQEGPWVTAFAVGEPVKLRGVLEDARLEIRFGSGELVD